MNDILLSFLAKTKTTNRQDAFTENYLTSQKSYVFSEVGVLIYVFDIESRGFESDLVTYNAVIKALEEYSPRAHVFCLVHKMDLVQNDFRGSLFAERNAAIRKRSERYRETVTCYATTIWDQSLYRAWGNIVHSLIPNLDIIEEYLENLAEAIEAEEVILFERTTFLTVMSVTSSIGTQNPFQDRQERLSNIIKTFKHSLASVCCPPFISCGNVWLIGKTGASLRHQHLHTSFKSSLLKPHGLISSLRN